MSNSPPSTQMSKNTEANNTLDLTEEIVSTMEHVTSTQDHYKPLVKATTDWYKQAKALTDRTAEIADIFLRLANKNGSSDIGKLYSVLGSAHADLNILHNETLEELQVSVNHPLAQDVNNDRKRYNSLQTKLVKESNKRDTKVQKLYEKTRKKKGKAQDKATKKYSEELNECTAWKNEKSELVRNLKLQQHKKFLKGFIKTLNRQYDTVGQYYAILHMLQPTIESISHELDCAKDVEIPAADPSDSDMSSSGGGMDSLDNPYEGYPTATAAYDYQGRDENEITFKVGDVIVVIEQTTQDWWNGVVSTQGSYSRPGLFPAAYVTMDSI